MQSGSLCIIGGLSDIETSNMKTLNDYFPTKGPIKTFSFRATKFEDPTHYIFV